MLDDSDVVSASGDKVWKLLLSSVLIFEIWLSVMLELIGDGIVE